MEELKGNIFKIYGRDGLMWLEKLPIIVERLQKHWHLRNIDPVANMSYHFVARAIDHENKSVVIKIGIDKKLILAEAQALRHFVGNGFAKLLDVDKGNNALLLEQAIPGITLKSLYPDQIEYVMDSYVSVTKQIHNLPFNTHWDTVEDLLHVIETAKTKLIPNNLILKALNLKIALLKSSKNKKLLHGDLHLGNILKQGDGWLCIDPKPIIGEPEFEMAAFDFIDTSEMQNATQELLKTRISLLASKSKLSEKRIRDWTFIRLILSAIWSIEDHNDPTIAIKLAHLI